MDIQYAMGNFIRDASQGETIRVSGDGTPFRSYLYAADLAIWLWTILFKGQPCHPYNVGSDRSISIAELADLVRQLVSPGIEITIAQHADLTHPPQRYVPSVERARVELSLESWVSLEQAIERTVSSLKGNYYYI
jgi:dTDP-glucose 4,6-dehydratase